MRAATGQTCDRTFDSAHPRKIALTIWTFIKITPSRFANWERKIMATYFIADPEITASIAPFGSMRQNPAAASTELREEMGEFVAQCPFNFGVAVIA